MSSQEKNKIFSVSELTHHIKLQLESKFSYCQVQGEVSNCKKQSSGHVYFTLKDSEAQIRCVLFRHTLEKLPMIPHDGDQLIVHGQITVYPPQGNYQILVLSCQKQGQGALLLRLQELKKELLALGWLDAARKKALPMLPKRIGVVTSPTGAVIQDIINVLNRRFGNVSLLLNPVRVQGEGAKEEIAKAIDAFNHFALADVIIVARGGGTIEDLWPFNEKIVAEAIFRSKIPVISAVGHETDTTLCDLVADVRAPTPSAAAELVVKEKQALYDKLDAMKSQLLKNFSHKVQSAQSKLGMIKKNPFFSHPMHMFSLAVQRLDGSREVFSNLIKNYAQQKKELLYQIKKNFSFVHPKSKLQQARELLKKRAALHYKQTLAYVHKISLHASLKKKSAELFTRYIHATATKRDLLSKISMHFFDIDPKNLLKKGFTILFSEIDHSIILSVKDIEKNQKIIAQLSDGTLRAQVEDILP